MKSLPLRIAISGPESTGKSQLAKELANWYNTTFVEEYAREYIASLNRPYVEADILTIAREQMRQEEQAAASANRLLFCDTELTVCKIWSQVKYNRCHPWITDTLESHPYPLYLLTDIDLPWEDDPQREHPLLRDYLFNLYKKEFDDRGVNYAIVRGSSTSRTQCAIGFVERFLRQIELSDPSRNF